MGFSLGGLVGGALKAVGLGKIAPFVSAGVNALTGNFAAAAFDVAGILGNIKGLGFLKNVADLAPLGGFGSSGGFNPSKLLGSGRGLSLSRLGNIRSLLGLANTMSGGKLNKFRAALNVIDQTMQNASMLRQTLTELQRTGTRV